MVAQEVFHSLKRREGGSLKNVAIELDMNKTYDRLDWGFLKVTLRAFGFDQRWVELVMTLVTTVTYQYKVNGFLTPPLTPQRGLSQGDPLSPYLFILVVEVLSQMINRAQNQGDIHGIQLSRSSPTLTHLFFADDALIFGRAVEEEIYQLVHILNTYCEASGQTINLTKFGLICGRHLNPRKETGWLGSYKCKCGKIQENTWDF